ncbi:MAG: hypothetical protein GX907_05100 [Clostridiaceae bacterium]|nr:hypothetical protein [Clostridiaceae bacterium]
MAPIILLSVVEYDEYGEGVICREITDFSAWLSRIRLPVLVAYLPWEGDQGAEIIPILEDRTLLFEERACFVIVREEVDDEVLENMLRPPAQSLILVYNTFEIARKDEVTVEDARTMLTILEEYIRSESGKASE